MCEEAAAQVQKWAPQTVTSPGRIHVVRPRVALHAPLWLPEGCPFECSILRCIGSVKGSAAENGIYPSGVTFAAPSSPLRELAAGVQPRLEGAPEQLARHVARAVRDRLPLEAGDAHDLAAPLAVAASVGLAFEDRGRTLPTPSP